MDINDRVAKRTAEHDQQTAELIDLLISAPSKEALIQFVSDPGMLENLAQWALIELGVKMLQRRQDEHICESDDR